MNNVVRRSLYLLFGLFSLLGSLMVWLVLPDQPGSSKTLHFEGFIPLPAVNNSSSISVLDFLTVSGGNLYATGISSGATYKIALQQHRALGTSEKFNITVFEGSPSVHEVIIDPATDLGFVTRSGEDTVDVFDTRTMQKTKQIAVAPDPDVILFDPEHRLIYAASAEGMAATLIDLEALSVAATIPLGGQGEYAVLDPKTKLIYQNLSDVGELVTVNPEQGTVVARYPLGDCAMPTGMAIDADDRRLFIACAKSSNLLVVDLEREPSIIKSYPISFGTDAVAYDSQSRKIYTTGLLGRMTVIEQESANNYRVIETVPLHFNAHTLTVDPATHQLFVGYTGFWSQPKIAVFTPMPG